MSDREKLFQLVDAIPDYKLCYAITYLQGLTDGGRAELNKETLEAFEEAERISKDPNVKSYTDVREMFREIWKMKDLKVLPESRKKDIIIMIKK